MRGDASARDPGLSQRVHGKPKDASFQIIVLGATGGPREDQVTGLLVRAPQSAWRKGSMIAVDAGAHLASIIRILQQHLPLYSKNKPPPGYSKLLEDGPFAGIKCPGYSARANALYIFRELMHAFLITHPHLDHLSGMGINTPALEYGREAKTIVALDTTIEAIKNHIFNDWIWPNLSDEGSGVGFVTYRRLREGGNARLGSGDARGYVRVCDSLATLCMPVTHGKCRQRTAVSHHRAESGGWPPDYMFPQQRRLSRMSDHESYFAAMHGQHNQHSHMPSSMAHLPSAQTTPGYPVLHTPTLSAIDPDHGFEAVKSSAFFILNEETGAEILVFGDIEPDSVSLSPQNYKVWRTASTKVANGNLKAIFIECSYDDSVRDADLYGHLCPRHLIGELTFLAKEVMERKASAQSAAEKPVSPVLEHKRPHEAAAVNETRRKRKKATGDSSAVSDSENAPLAHEAQVTSPVVSPYVGNRSSRSSVRKPSLPPVGDDISPIALRGHSPTRSLKHVHFQGAGTMSAPPPNLLAAHVLPPLNVLDNEHEGTNGGPPEKMSNPLKGLTVHIIHVKDTLVDGPTPGEIIAEQLRVHGEEVGLGCTFDVTDFGESIWV